MKRLVTTTVLALLALAPAIGAACEYKDASIASSSPSPSEQLGMAPAPAASTIPAPVQAKAPAPKTVKQATDRSKTSSDARLVAVKTN